MSPWRIIRFVLVAAVLAGIVGFFVWTQQVAKPAATQLKSVTDNQSISIHETPHSYVLYHTSAPSDRGIVFLPGAKVDPRAYFYKLSGIVESSGITVVVTKPSFNLPLFDFRPIATFENDVSGVENWYVAGHSLGGVRACQYAADQSTHVKGLILFASYCNTKVALPTLSLSGANDKLSTPQKIKDNAVNLPADTDFEEIPDAAHASFGDYGVQSGDGTAAIDAEFMRLEVTDYVNYWLAQH